MIPRSFIYESKEYLITSILKGAFEFRSVKTIQFAEDSEIRTIERNDISGLIELQEGWCIDTIFCQFTSHIFSRLCLSYHILYLKKHKK